MNFTVFSTDIYEEARIKLNPKDQRLVQDKIREWMNNPEADGKRFKKLPNQGKNIFSLRVSSVIRVIIGKYDSDYYLLYTGSDHDKTNSWAKTKNLKRNTFTGKIQLYSSAVDILEQERQVVQEPVVKQDDTLFGKYTEEQLLQIGVPEEWVASIRRVETEDAFMRYWDHLPQDVVNDLNELLLGGGDIQLLIADIERDKKAKEKLSKKEQIRAQPGLYVVGEDDALIQAMQDDINIFRFYLHPQQYKHVYGDFNGPVKLTGGAGTGKTVVAMRRAQQLVNKLADGQKPVFFTTFTKALIRNIASTFAGQKLSKDKLKVSNLHKFALDFAKEAQVLPANAQFIFKEAEIKKHWEDFVSYLGEIPFTGDFLRKEYEQVIQEQHITTLDQYLNAQRKGRGEALVASKREIVWKLFDKYDFYLYKDAKLPFRDLIFKLIKDLEKNPEKAPFSHIICDEVQDFSNLELRLLRHLVAEGPNDLFLTGDPFQNIYGRVINFSQSGINIRGKRSSRLRINYRTTEEIRTFAVSMLDGFDYNDFSGELADITGDASRLHGYDPQYYHFENSKEEQDFILRFLRDSYGTIGMHETCITASTKGEMEALEAFLKANHIAYVNLSDVEDLSQHHGKVIVGNMHKLKGLEFKNILFAGLNKSNFPYLPTRYHNMSADQKKDFLKKLHALYYVVFSRPISQLILTGHGESVESLEMYLMDGVEV